LSLAARASLRTVALAVGDVLRRHDIRATLTGGACAAIHSGGFHSSVDVDFVLGGPVARTALDAALKELGFRRERDRYVHPRIRFYVAFPSGPLAIGDDIRVRPHEIRSGSHRVLALSPTDSCRDRLAGFYFWKDRQSLRVAVEIAVRSRVDLRKVREWSRREGQAEAFEVFRSALAERRQTKR
jgi:hypothetical protein